MMMRNGPPGGGGGGVIRVALLRLSLTLFLHSPV